MQRRIARSGTFGGSFIAAFASSIPALALPLAPPVDYCMDDALSLSLSSSRLSGSCPTVPERERERGLPEQQQQQQQQQQQGGGVRL